MIVEITLGILLAITSYTTFNQLRKVERLESWIEDYAQRVIDTQKTLREIDNKGNSFANQLKKIAKKINIPEFTMTWARHSYSTKALRDGYSMKQVGELMNHGSTKTTENYFAGFTTESADEIQDSLSNFENEKSTLNPKYDK